jgi:hypothetical protein
MVCLAKAGVAIPDRPDECLDPFFARQSETQQLAFVFQIDMEAEKRAARAFGGYPIRSSASETVDALY